MVLDVDEFRLRSSRVVDSEGDAALVSVADSRAYNRAPKGREKLTEEHSLLA